MNYRDERAHDELLIRLVNELNEYRQLHLVAEAFDIEGGLGKLECAKHRRPFDVELTFSNLSIVIETKVDSDESGRWGNTKWQTATIEEISSSLNYLKENKKFLFITYGTSEFYTKPDKECPVTPYRTGPFSSQFKHIRLDRMINLVHSAEKVLPPCEKRREWLRLMGVEKRKRSKSIELLQSFSNFRTRYLDLHEEDENDFPHNRLVFCAPELAFPALDSLAQQWNGSKYADKFGKVALYPVPRMSPPVHDSILNFWEMWQSGKPALGTTIDKSRESNFYFEINEDFNLNLKLEVEEGNDLDCNARNEVWSRLENANWPCFVKGRRRDYRQAVLVLYEIDFNLLNELNNLPQAMSNLAATLDIAVKALP